MKHTFLPPFPGRAWCGLWIVAVLTSAGNRFGSRLDWFTYSADVGMGCMLVIGLLAFTTVHR